MSDQTIYNMMIRVVEIIYTQNENYKDLELEDFGLKINNESDIRLKEKMLNYFLSFVKQYREIISVFKNKEDGIENIGLLWFKFCENNDIIENLENTRRNTRKLTL